MFVQWSQRLHARSGHVADASIAAAVLVLTALASVRAVVEPRAEAWPITALGWALICLTCTALYVRRRWPVPAAAVVLMATAGYYLTSVYDGPLMIAVVVALYTVAASGGLQQAVGLAALTVVGVGVGTLAGNPDVTSVGLFMLAGWLVATVALGWLQYTRQLHRRELEQRAAEAERLRIARDLHDALGHRISLLCVQSGAALHRLARHPNETDSRLRALRCTSQEALRDLRAIVGALRTNDEQAPTSPPPGLQRVDELLLAARADGLAVDAVIDVGGSELPSEVDLAAYRIVQESLTNVVRHAHARTVRLRVVRSHRQVRIDVTDDGRASPGDVAGAGIAGMRERARALGGRLTAGPSADGHGFGVHAQLPCPAGDRPSRMAPLPW